MRRRASELIREFKIVKCPEIRKIERSTSPNSLGSLAGLVRFSKQLTGLLDQVHVAPMSSISSRLHAEGEVSDMYKDHVASSVSMF